MGVTVDVEQAVWDANLAAVQEAKAACVAAVRAQAAVEAGVGEAIAARGGGWPNAEERQALIDAQDAYRDATARLADAKATFKAGVTPEAIAAYQAAEES